MAKRKKVPKTGPVLRMTSEENTLRQMPKYNGFAVSAGPHGDRKYNRAKQKRQWRKEDSTGVSVLINSWRPTRAKFASVYIYLKLTFRFCSE